MRTRLPLLLLALVLVATGCGGSESATPPPEIPEGFEQYDGARHGFTIALPSDWITFDPSTDTAAALAADLGKTPDEIEPDLEELSGAIGGSSELRLLASGGTSDLGLGQLGESPFLVIYSIPQHQLDVTLNDLEEHPEAVASGMGGSLLDVDRVEINGLDTLCVKVEMPLEPSQAEPSRVWLYFIAPEDGVLDVWYYVLAALPMKLESYIQTVDTIMHTFESPPSPP